MRYSYTKNVQEDRGGTCDRSIRLKNIQWVDFYTISLLELNPLIMSASGTRAIVLNDNDPVIKYEGPWTLLETSAGSFGTVHQIASPSGTVRLSVNFTGQLLSAFGAPK